MPKPQEQQYLGDGVYAFYDGYQVWVETVPGNKIALEFSVMQELIRYSRKVYGNGVIQT